MGLRRLPIPVGPARHETVTSYLARLAGLHGMHPRELWEAISTPRPGSTRRDIAVEALASITGRPVEHLMAALPELRRPAPDWAAWRHQTQPRCPRCDARHDGGPVRRVLPHHRYVCTRHRYWIGPPDIGQQAIRLDTELDDIVTAQRRHERLVRSHGAAATYDAVLTGFLICGHLWDPRRHEWTWLWPRWSRRAEHLIPVGRELASFSASKLFAATYPEAVDFATVIAAPAWRTLASGDIQQRQRFIRKIGQVLGRPRYRPAEAGDPIAHWMTYDSCHPPSKPTTLFPQTREYGALRPANSHCVSRERHHRHAYWFGVNRRGGALMLHHRHIRPVLIRDWSPPMDGIAATIWASQSTPTPRQPMRRFLVERQGSRQTG